MSCFALSAVLCLSSVSKHKLSRDSGYTPSAQRKHFMKNRLRRNSISILLLSLCLILAIIITTAEAVVERDPSLTASSGIVLVTPAQVEIFCPLCEESEICCKGITQDSYTCIRNYTTEQRDTVDTMCAADGSVCEQEPMSIPSDLNYTTWYNMQMYNSSAYSFTCTGMYLGFVPCKISPFMDTLACAYMPGFRGLVPKCISGNLNFCDGFLVFHWIDYIFMAIFIIIELVVLIVIIACGRRQPLSARNPVLLAIQLIAGVIFVVGAATLQSVLPCPIWLWCLLYGFAGVFLTALCRSIYLCSAWNYSQLKKKIGLMRLAQKKLKVDVELEATRSAALREAKQQGGNDQLTMNTYSESSPYSASPSITSPFTGTTQAGINTNTDAGDNAMLLEKVKSRAGLFRRLGTIAVALPLYLFTVLLIFVIYVIIMAVFGRDSMSQPNYWRAKPCAMTDAVVGIFFAIFGVYVILMLVMFIVMRKIRDAYNIWVTTVLEYAVTLAFIILVIILQATLWTTSDWGYGSAGRYFTQTLVYGLWLICVQVIGIIAPAIHTFFWNKKSAAALNAIEAEKRRKNGKQLPDDLSLTVFLTHKKLQPLFYEHCCREFSSENPLFWTDALEYRTILDDDRRRLRGKEIYNTFVAVGGLLELNIDTRDRDLISQRLEDAPLDLYDRLVDKVEVVMIDTFSRFTSTPQFKRIEAKVKDAKQKEKLVECAQQ